jgi:hypothetical protein
LIQPAGLPGENARRLNELYLWQAADFRHRIPENQLSIRNTVLGFSAVCWPGLTSLIETFPGAAIAIRIAFG